MNPHMLIETTARHGLPAPIWFIEFFKVLGFSLHEVPMNLWYAGILVAMLLHLAGRDQGRRFSARLMSQMPVIIAVGVNFGVVPLLFIQVAYYRVFYPATILMAWFWLAIIVLLILAYYGVYLYAFGLRAEGRMTALRRAAGWGSALLFIVIGFLFANGLSLMTNVGAWPELFHNTSTAGAALGTALNVAEPSLWPRWLLMFGLALGTTAAWIVVDAAWFGAGESEEYRRWAPGFAWRLYTLGLVWFAAAGSWYVFGTWPADVGQSMLAWPLIVLTIVTALAPGLPWLILVMLGRRREPVSRGLAALAGLAQFGVLAVNAVSRQIVQNVELSPYFRVASQAEEVQWSPLVTFLLVFVAGACVIAWIIFQAVKAAPNAGQAQG